MRACFLSDLHSHTWKQFARVLRDGLNSRLSDLSFALGEVWLEAQRRRVVDVYIAGDLFHVKRHVPVQAETVLYNSFSRARELGLRLHIIAGNHDQVEDDPWGVTPQIFRDVAEVFVKPEFDKQHGIAYVPWQFDQDRVRKFIKDAPDGDLLLYHGEVSGAFVGPTDYQLKSKMKLKQLMIEKFRWTMMGHLHRRQMIAERCYYIGNPLPKDRGEPEQDKGAIFIVDDKIDVFVTSHPRFVNLDVTVNPPPHFDEWLKQTKDNFVYLTVPATIGSKDLEELLGALQGREYEVHRAPRAKEETVKRTAIRIGQTLEEMFDHYVDEEAGGDTLKKEFGRALLQEAAVEGESH